MSKGFPASPYQPNGSFIPYVNMSPAWMDDKGVMRWATYCNPMDGASKGHALEQWEQTSTAVEYVQKRIRERQEELEDKKLFAADPILMELRQRARAIGNYRHEINAYLLKLERKERLRWG